MFSQPLNELKELKSIKTIKTIKKQPISKRKHFAVQLFIFARQFVG